MIAITVTVHDVDQAEEVVNHLMCDGMMYMALPLQITIRDTEVDDETDKDTD